MTTFLKIPGPLREPVVLNVEHIVQIVPLTRGAQIHLAGDRVGSDQRVAPIMIGTPLSVEEVLALLQRAGATIVGSDVAPHLSAA